MKFCWSTLKVNNMNESLEFYQEIIGLTIDRNFKAGPGMEIAFLGNGETKVELIYDENDKEINVGEDISLGFEVDSVDDMIRYVKEKGIEIHSGPFQPNPYTRFFYVKDPNGLKIQFIENK
ncbi:VOC family protein [Clostridium sp. D2Q-11]|uniref:VOC family protein n=1 Tax=Anaeromonas frigoriresistens TaxID=2683708 RepID=A0A942UXP8_9FIRM|nr:VOC family protein [Anaeromonas frigoriresistens]MBS4539500.1 VOC family protein [Anaeromonas frigoriresistens]